MSDSIGSVSVEVVPDARGFSERLKSQLRDQQVEVKANADTEEANAELDKTARPRTAKIKADVSQLSQGASKLDQFVGNLGLLPSLALAAGSALIPLAAAIGGVAAAISAPLIVAGGGVGLFGVLAGFAVSNAEKQLKAIQVLQTHLATLTKGTAAYAATQKQLQAAQSALPAGVKQFSSALEGLKSTFAHVDMTVLLKPITAGIGLLTQLLPLIQPLLKTVSGALTGLVGDLSKAADSPGFKRFLAQITSQMAPDIVTFAHIAGNAIKGITGIIVGLSTAFGGPGGGVLHGLDQLSGKFADLGSGAGHSKWLKDFAEYFHRVGPGVASTLQSLARAFGHIVAALAPLGPGVLGIIKGLADQFNRIPIGTLTILGKTIAELVIFQKLGGFKAIGFLDKKGLLGRAATGGLGAEVAASAKPVPVIVTNWPPGFGGKGGPGAPVAPVPTGPLAAANAEAALASRTGGILSDGGIARILAAGLLRKAGPALLGVTAGDIGNEVDGTRHPVALSAAQKRALAAPFSPAGTAFIKAIRDGVTPTATAYDALKAHAAAATRELDLAGPHIHQTMAGATDDVNRFAGVLNSIKDKRIKVIADTADAIRSLERLQAMRIHDKYFNVYQVYNGNERAVGPGGGIGMHNVPGSAPRTSSASGGGASTGRGGDTYNIQAHNYNDFLRQLDSRRRGRSGGGVVLAGSR